MAPAAPARVLLLTRQLTPLRLSFALPPRPAARGYLLVLTLPHRQCAAADSYAATTSSGDGEQHPQAPSATPGTTTGPHEGDAAARGVSKAAGAQDGNDGAAAAASRAPAESLLAAAAGRRRRPSPPKGPGGGPKQGRGGGGGIIHDVPSSSSTSSSSSS